ncbi:MAG: hypothetical protein AVDCRST_MAG70-950, partial [uncultured Thermomicrobiales bacterium]
AVVGPWPTTGEAWARRVRPTRRPRSVPHPGHRPCRDIVRSMVL